MQKGSWTSHFRPRWLLVTLLVAACVLGLTHIPGPSIPRTLQDVAPDKLEHVVAYGLMAGSFLLSLKKPLHPVLLLLGLAALAGVGVLDELTQPFVSRSADLWDYVSDLTGMAIATGAFLLVKLAAPRAAAP